MNLPKLYKHRRPPPKLTGFCSKNACKDFQEDAKKQFIEGKEDLMRSLFLSKFRGLIL